MLNRIFLITLIFSNVSHAKLFDDEPCVEKLISLNAPAFPFKAVGKILVNDNDINDIEIVTATGMYNIEKGVASGTANNLNYSQSVVNGINGAAALFYDDPDKVDSLLQVCMMAEDSKINNHATTMMTKRLKRKQKQMKDNE